MDKSRVDMFMNIAFSPCPNDTFVFHGWVHGHLLGAPDVNVTYADIDITNQLATRPDGPDVMKISYAALPWVYPEYVLLQSGGALGRGCGPLVLTATEEPISLGACRVAIPSQQSTAYLLFRLWCAEHMEGEIQEICVLPFYEIMPAVREGRVDAGLVIHEARFTYRDEGLHCHVDLGEWWESSTGLPIPLGAIIARRNLDTDAISHWIRMSVEYAWQHPEASKEYILQHAQEMDPKVIQAHIDLYVNEFTLNVGKEGTEAALTLLNRAAARGLVPPVDPRILGK